MYSGGNHFVAEVFSTAEMWSVWCHVEKQKSCCGIKFGCSVKQTCQSYVSLLVTQRNVLVQQWTDSWYSAHTHVSWGWLQSKALSPAAVKPLLLFIYFYFIRFFFCFSFPQSAGSRSINHSQAAYGRLVILANWNSGHLTVSPLEIPFHSELISS